MGDRASTALAAESGHETQQESARRLCRSRRIVPAEAVTRSADRSGDRVSSADGTAVAGGLRDGSRSAQHSIADDQLQARKTRSPLPESPSPSKDRRCGKRYGSGNTPFRGRSGGMARLPERWNRQPWQPQRRRASGRAKPAATRSGGDGGAVRGRAHGRGRARERRPPPRRRHCVGGGERERAATTQQIVAAPRNLTGSNGEQHMARRCTNQSTERSLRDRSLQANNSQ